MPELSVFRDSIEDLAPPWLATGAGQRVLYLPGLLTDALTQAALDGVKSRFPGYGLSDALTFIGADRQIVRGPDEPDADYIIRLQKWLDSWQHAGSPYGLLPQLEGLNAPVIRTWRTVDNSSNWYWINAGDTTLTINSSHGAANWNWDGLSTQWARFWTVLYLSPQASFDERFWGDGLTKWGDGGVWGLSLTPGQVESIRVVIRNFKPAHATWLWGIVAFDATTFDPSASYPSAGLPDGQWGRWSKDSAGNRIQSRLESARYISGVT